MAEEARKRGWPPPKEIAELEKLDLWPANREAWAAFQDLHPCRQQGMGIGPIPLSEILAWFAIQGRSVNPVLADKIRLLDSIWLEVEAEKTTTTPLGKGPPGPPGKGKDATGNRIGRKR